MAEIGISEFINIHMYDYLCKHVGKDLFRKKECEEDICVENKITGELVRISLKAYGYGPLQLSTDKKNELFNWLDQYDSVVEEPRLISEIWDSPPFRSLTSLCILPLIYKEKEKMCNIMVFDIDKAKNSTCKILKIASGQQYDHATGSVTNGGSRKHPVFLFVDGEGNYICEVRYGNAAANALQRGFWSETAKAGGYFHSLTNGWVSYEHNMDLVRLIALALNSRANAHIEVCSLLQRDIEKLKELQ